MKFMSRLILMLVPLLVLGFSSSCQAQDYPSRPVTLIIPFGPGSTPDVTGRFFAGALQTQLGQQFVVENRGGVVGMRVVKAAAPNGLTLLWDSSGATGRTYHPVPDIE